MQVDAHIQSRFLCLSSSFIQNEASVKDTVNVSSMLSTTRHSCLHVADLTPSSVEDSLDQENLLGIKTYLFTSHSTLKLVLVLVEEPLHNQHSA